MVRIVRVHTVLTHPAVLISLYSRIRIRNVLPIYATGVGLFVCFFFFFKFFFYYNFSPSSNCRCDGDDENVSVSRLGVYLYKRFLAVISAVRVVVYTYIYTRNNYVILFRLVIKRIREKRTVFSFTNKPIIKTQTR